jgi:hypothetical protein
MKTNSGGVSSSITRSGRWRIFERTSFQYRSWWNHRKELSTSVPSPAAAVEVDVVVVVVDDGVVVAEQVTGVAGEEEGEGCVTNMTVGVGAVVWIRLTDETAAGDGLGRIIA